MTATSYFKGKKLPWTLMIAGLGMNLIDISTTKTGESGGKLFGPAGALKAVNDKLPSFTVPGTKTDANPAGVMLNLGGWLVLIGAGLWAYHKFGK